MRLRSLVAAAGLWILAVPASAFAAGDEGALARDKRLDRVVSITAERTYLGEVLEKASLQAGIPLEVEDHLAPISGMQLTASFQVPARDLLVGVRELLSYRFSSWSWTGTAAGGYRLAPAESVGEAANRARKVAEARFAADLKLCRATAEASDAEKEQRATERPDLFGGRMMTPESAGLFLGLTPADLRSLVDGRTVTLRAEHLSPAGRRALRIGRLGPLAPEEEPTEGTLAVGWSNESLGPVLHLRSSLGSSSALGGRFWDNAWYSSLAPGWTIHSQRPRGLQPPGAPIAAAPPAAIALEIARERKVNVLIDFLGNNVGRAGGIVLAEDPQEALNTLGLHFRLAHKKQESLHLLRHIAIPSNRREGLVAWPEIRSFRQSMERNQGYPDLEMLLRFSQLTYAQLVHLLPEYGDVNINTDQLDDGRVWRGILTFLRMLPAEQRKLALSKGGMAYRDAAVEARLALGKASEEYHLSVVSRLNEDLNGARVRYAIEPGEILVLNQPGQPRKQPGRKLLWEVTYSNGKVLTRYYPLQIVDKQAVNKL